ncbi:MAG TPA: hypothetical protein VGE52_15935, partial [Pirellulales bacterium]
MPMPRPSEVSSAAAPPGSANEDLAALPLPPPERLQQLLFDAARLGRDDVIPALVLAGARIS